MMSAAAPSTSQEDATHADDASPPPTATTTTTSTFSSSSNDKAKKVLHHVGDSAASSGGKDNGSNKTRHCNSLPLFQNSELCEIGSRPGMDCMPLRAPPGPYHHYHVADQTKSLQELQNEVGALLEFRDLVIETFPDLKHKMASMSATNTLTGMASSSLASRREWEPGIRVKRKITQKENAEMSSSSLIRSRSNSHSGKKEPKSGEGNGSVVQDSGFSTETSSSKEAHSASSTTGAMQGAVATNRLLSDANDELLNLLDVIHRKSNRLRDEVEHLQNLERSKLRRNVNNSSNSSESNSCLNKTFQEHVDRLNKEDIQILRKERDRLLDKLAEMEAETLAGRIKATKMQDQFEELCSIKKELEEQLKLALSQKLELNSRLHELQKQYVNKSSSSSQSDSTSQRNSSTSTVVSAFHGQHGASSALGLAVQSGRLTLSPATFTPVIVDQATSGSEDHNKIIYPFHSSDIKQVSNDLKNLGRLDGLVSSPNRVSKVRVTDSKKIAAILLETNVLELQRHLLTLTVQNQVLTQRLEQATKSKIVLMKKLDKSKEDIDDLRFQLEEKDIELEGTKAQLRVLESKNQIPSKLDLSTETNRSSSTIILSSRDSPMTPTQISTPSMKAMTPLAMDEIQQHSSSTESAQDHTERESRLAGGSETPKRRPSKIPLPGSKGYLAPKPPTGRAAQKSPGSGPGSNKSLSRSTGNLYGKSGPPSVRRDTTTQSSSLNRPDSAQSIRKDSSLGTNSRSSSSSIPISSKSTPSPHKISSSPLPKPKRDSLTSRVRHLDSLSRVYSNNSPVSPTSPTGASNCSNNSSTSTSNHSSQLVTGSVTNLHRLSSNSKKDLSSSFTQGQSRDRNKSTVSVRRVSSASVGRSATAELQQNETDNGKMNKLRKVESMESLEIVPKFARNGQKLINSRNLISEYIAKTCPPPAILTPSNPAYELPSPDVQMDLAYKHPQLLLKMMEDEVSYQTEKEVELKFVTSSPTRRRRWCLDPSRRSDECKLIGKVNPSIAKTWDQLSCTNRNLTRSVSNNSDDSEKILFYQPVLENEANFHVNKISYSDDDDDDDDDNDGESSSCNFYDSIDDNNNKSGPNPNENIVSLCHHQEAGEEMAEYCWSLESEYK